MPAYSPNSHGRAQNPAAGFWSGVPVLVTGHTGFKGGWLSLWLHRLGAQVVGLGLEPDSQPNLFDQAVRGRISDHIIDVRDFAAVRACLNAVRPRIVFHLAAQSLVRPSYEDPVGTYATNVMGTIHLLEAVRQVPSVEAVVVVTSDKAYENREWHWAYREDEPMGGHDPYSSSKGCAELVTRAYRSSFFQGRDHAVQIASARAGNVIGGGDWSRDRLVPDLVRAFSSHVPVEIRAPSSTRPWQHVLEPLSGYIRLAECLAGEGGAGFAEAWNFGPADEDCRPVAHIVETLAQAWGEGASWRVADVPHLHEATFLKVDASKARAHLGWDRRLGLDEALSWTAEWYTAFGDGSAAAELTLAQIERYEAIAERNADRDQT